MTDAAKLREPAGLHWRYRLRLAAAPLLAKVGRAAGVSWRRLGRALGPEVLIAQAPTIGRDGGTGRAETCLDVAFLSMLGGHVHNLSVDAVLALALQARGHRVRCILCDQVLPICEVKKAGREDRWAQACGKCYAFARRYLPAFGLDVVPLSAVVPDAPAAAERWADIVESALLKHYGVGLVDDTPQVRQRREALARSAALSAAAGEALIRAGADRVIMSHGIYCTWGPANEVLHEAGLATVIYGKGKRKHTEHFNWYHGSAWWDVSEEWETWRRRGLTQQEERRLDGYLASRRTHSADVLVYNFGEAESREATRRRLRLDGGKPTFVLFTNVLWDAASTNRQVAFADPIEWVMATIAWFADRPEKQLVVKVHPAELVIGTNQSFVSLIRRRFPELPDNVRLIEPQEKVNSWSIISIADLGLVHTSTVGLELPIEGVPCAVVSRTPYQDKGFTIDVHSREEYFRLIETWDGSRVDRREMQVLARRYAYLLFERYQLPFPFFDEPSHTDVRSLRFDSVGDLLRSEGIQVFLKAVEEKGSFLLPAD